MKRKYLLFAIALCLAALSLSGCMTATRAPTPTATPNVIATPAPTPAPTATVNPQGSKAARPGQLDELESASEDIMDDAGAGDWTKAQQKVNTIKADLTALGPVFQSAGVPSNLVEGIRTPLKSLEQKVKSKDAMGTKVQANQITSVIPDIFDYFQVTAPTDLGRLDYLGREVALNAQQGNWKTAGSNMTQIKKVWARLKPNLNSAAQKSAANFESSINALSGDVQKKAATAVAKDSSTLLDNVDVLEKAYG